MRPWHAMAWLSVTYCRGHATDAPWPCLDEYAMAARGYPWSSMAVPRVTMVIPRSIMGMPWSPIGMPWSPIGMPWSPMATVVMHGHNTSNYGHAMVTPWSSVVMPRLPLAMPHGNLMANLWQTHGDIMVAPGHPWPSVALPRSPIVPNAVITRGKHSWE